MKIGSTVTFAAVMIFSCKQRGHGDASLSANNASRIAMTEAADAELKATNLDKNGCLWDKGSLDKLAKDSSFATYMTAVCLAEKKSLELTNNDRRATCSNDLTIDSRLSYISRENARNYVALVNSQAIAWNNYHYNFSQGYLAQWFQSWYPALARLMSLHNENWAMTGFLAQNVSAEALASNMISTWIHSDGHHRAMIDCSNNVIGVGYYWADRYLYNGSFIKAWIGYMVLASNNTAEI